MYNYQPFIPVGNVRLSAFSGEQSKGEASFEQWCSEVAGLMNDPSITPSMLMQGIRRSLRGRAADVVRHLGVGTDPDTAVQKLDRIFGSVLPAEALLENFYTARQGSHETVAMWAMRLEDIVCQLKSRQSPSLSLDVSKEMLRTKFWSGLHNPSVKNALRYRMDAHEDYEEILEAARVAESEGPTPHSAQPKVTHLSAGGHMEQRIDALTEQLGQVKETLKQLGLHGSQQPFSTVIQHPQTPQPSAAFRMPPPQQTGVPSINPAFPQGRTNFRGKCFKCGKVGHKKAFCPGN